MQLSTGPGYWPRWSSFECSSAALLVIDMQVDFCHQGGYLDRMGCDLAPFQKPVENIARLLKAARAAALLTIYTRQGFRPDLADMPASRRREISAGRSIVGSSGPLGQCLIRGEAGWQIIDALAPVETDVLVDKTACSAFYGTDLDTILRMNGVAHLILCGNTLDICVHSTLRSADDRGYECLVVSDACGCRTEDLHEAALEMIRGEGGVLGAVAPTDTVARFLQQNDR